MATQHIKVKNIGPIERLDIPVPDGGGFVVVRGRNGAGKSTAIKAVSELLGGDKTDIMPRDLTEKGCAEYGGAKLTVSLSRHSTRGQLEFTGIESRFDIGNLVDPGIKNKDKADERRVKQLIALSGVKVDPSIYHELVGGSEAFQDLAIDCHTDDPLLLATRIKAALMKRASDAKRQESRLCTLAQDMQAKINDDMDVSSEHDEDRLRAAYDNARDEMNRTIAQREAWELGNQQVKDAKANIEKLEKSGDDIEELTQRLDIQESRIKALRGELEEATEEKRRLENRIQSEKKRRLELSELKTMVASMDVGKVTHKQVNESKTRVDECVHAMHRGEDIRQEIFNRARLKDLTEQRQKHIAAETEWIKKAGGVYDVLTSQMPECPLKISDGRLVVKTKRSDREPYSQLSDGQRWMIAIEVAAQFLKNGELTTADQKAFDGLTPKSRKTIDEKLRKQGVHCLTAVAVDEDLHAESYAS